MHPCVRPKRQNFWKVADALTKFLQEGDDYILEISSLGIYDTKRIELLGTASEETYEWNAERLALCFPRLDLAALRMAAVRRSARQ